MKTKLGIIALIAILLAASLGVVNATVFHMGGMSGNVKVYGNTGLSTSDAAGLGEACAGFYIYGASSGNTIQKSGVLPPAGSNHENFVAINSTGRNLGVNVIWGRVACEWGSSSPYNTTYSNVQVDLNVTVGSWYIKDFLGFGYPNILDSQDPNTVYVVFKVPHALDATGVNSAWLFIYSGTTRVARLNLLSTNAETTPIQLNKGDGLQLDLYISSNGAGSGQFAIYYYVSTADEGPR